MVNVEVGERRGWNLEVGEPRGSLEDFREFLSWVVSTKTSCCVTERFPLDRTFPANVLPTPTASRGYTYTCARVCTCVYVCVRCLHTLLTSVYSRVRGAWCAIRLDRPRSRSFGGCPRIVCRAARSSRLSHRVERGGRPGVRLEVPSFARLLGFSRFRAP